MGIMQKLIDVFRRAEEGTSPASYPAVAGRPALGVQDSEMLLDAPRVASEKVMHPISLERQNEPRSGGVKKAVLNEGDLSILDLRDVPSLRVRIVGTGYWVTESGLSKYGAAEYLLVREPKNKWDANAIGVYGKGRKVGHLSAGKAAALAPILDPLGFDAYRIGGAPISDNSRRIWADVPAIPKLRAFAKSLGKERG